MFGGTARDAAIGLPREPLDRLFAEPSRHFLEAHGHQVRCGTPATLLADGDRVVGVDLHGERIHAGAVISTVPWFALSTVAADVPALEPLISNAARMTSSPIVTVNLWLDGPVAEAAFVGFPGRRFQWLFDKARLFGDRTSHVSLVASGADEIVGFSNDALVDLARGELSEALPGRWSVIRATAVREKRATFSLAPGEPPRPSAETPVRRFFLAGDWTDTGLPATIESAVLSGHRAAGVGGTARLTSDASAEAPCRSHAPRASARAPQMTSVIIHYQEIALKGRNRPWFIERLLHNLRVATSDLGVQHVRTMMGRIELVLARRRRLGRPARTAVDDFRHRELLEGRAHLVESRNPVRAHPRRSRRSRAGVLCRRRAARRQAVSDPLPRDRAARSARGSRWRAAGASTCHGRR